MSSATVEPSNLEAKSSKKKRRKGAKAKANGITNQKSMATPELEAEEVKQIDAAPHTSPGESDGSELDESEAQPAGTSTETSVEGDSTTDMIRGPDMRRTTKDADDTKARFDALVKDRDILHTEVTELRESLEEFQSKHEMELEAMREQLQETQGEKEEAEEQYQNLLGKVNTIKAQLGERLKADAEDLAQARTRIEELEDQSALLQEQYTTKSAEHESLVAENLAQSKELSSIRSRANLSQQNWLKEKEEFVEQETFLREEFENAKQAMHDWEVLAMEERSIRRDLGEKVGDLEEQLSSLRDAYEKASNEKDVQSNTVDGLQKALQEIQTARKIELRELVESSQIENETLRKQLQEARQASSAAQAELESTRKELERALPFEKEVKEKNLLIGKVRHEAVILNDHLTKALRFLEKGKPEDNIDRQIVTNHFLHFLALDRSDPKKFQILQLIAALLDWNEEQREQAGLARPGGTASVTGSLRLPGSPLFHRTPSTPALASDLFSNSSPTSKESKESLADLWQNFLEQEAQAGSNSRKASMTETPRPR